MNPRPGAAALVIVAWIGQASADAPIEPAAESPAEVIVIEEEAPDPDVVRLPAAELRELPGAFGDPVRAAAVLAGVAPAESNRPDVYIRGAPPGNTAVFVDGIRVPLLFHGGVLSSIVPAAIVEALDVTASAPPARFGNVAGAVIEIETRTPAVPQLRGEARLTAFELGGLVETPVAGTRGSVLAAARLGYPQFLIGLLADSGIDLSYWDYQARTSWRVGDHGRLTLFGFGSHDYLAEEEDSPEGMGTIVEELTSEFHRVELRYDHATATSKMRAAVTGGWTRQGAEDLDVGDRSFSARLEGELAVSARVQLRAGARLDVDDYTLYLDPDAEDPAADSVATAAPPPRNLTPGLYADVVWQLTPALRLVPGLRVAVFDSERAVSGASHTIPVLEPRLSARWRVRPDLALLAAAAQVHQYPLLRVGAAPPTAITVPGFWAGSGRLQRARQASAGVEWLLPAGVTATATAYGSVTTGMTDLMRECQEAMTAMVPMPAEEPSPCPDAPSTGVAYGLELSLRRPLTARLAGLFSYTFMHSTVEKRVDGVAITRAGPFDRPHVISTAITYQLTAHWRTAARLSAYSGEPFLIPAVDDQPAYQVRLPWFHRVDLRAERRWALADDRSISLVFDFLNATFSSEHTFLCRDQSCEPRTGDVFFVPSIGLEGSL